MWADDFDPAATLAAVQCLRCDAMGFTQIDSEPHDAVPTAERLPTDDLINPSVQARCASFGAVGG